MTLKYRELKRRYDLDGADQTVTHLSEALREGHLKPEDFSIRDLAEALVPDGHEWVRLLDPRSAGGVSVLESADGVDVTAFLNITGQVIYSQDHGGLHAGSVRRLEAGRYDPDAARRREDSGHFAGHRHDR